MTRVELWTEVGAVAAAAQVLILLGAAIFAWLQVREARTLRREQTRPYVIVYLRLHPESPSVAEIVVENIGATPAKDVRVAIDPPFVSSLDRGGGGRVDTWGLIARGVAQIAPHQQLSTFADVLHSRFGDESLLSSYTVKIPYKDGRGKEKFTDTSVLDFDAFRGKHYLTPKNIGDVVDQLKKVASVLESWKGPLVSGLVVLTKDYDTAMDEVLERYREHTGSTAPSDAQVPPATQGEDPRV